jgi:anti-sigma regulatory factor (Ser/Thr protein kinase)
MTGARPHGRDGPVAGLTHHVERHEGVLVLGLSGPLEPPDAATVRTALLQCLGEFPAALVVDLSQLRAGDDHQSLLAFPAALRDANGWPPVPVLICVPDPELLERLEELPFREPPRWFPSIGQALAAAAAAGQLADRFTTTLPATPQAPARARALLHRACQAWRLTELAPAAEVVLSELSANAVVHARTTMRIIIQRTPTALHLVVRDADPTPPRQRSLPPAGTPVDSGNGLNLVAAFASDWGTMPTPDGKAVWATLRIGGDRDEITTGPAARVP